MGSEVLTVNIHRARAGAETLDVEAGAIAL